MRSLLDLFRRRPAPETTPEVYPAPSAEHALAGFYRHLEEMDDERDRAHPLYADWVADGEICPQPKTTERFRARMTTMAPLDEEITLVPAAPKEGEAR